MTRSNAAGVRRIIGRLSLAVLVMGAAVAALLPAMAADEPPKEWDGLLSAGDYETLIASAEH